MANGQRQPDELEPLCEPRRLFGAANLSAFVECGGFDGLQSPAKMSAFNSHDDCFVSIFPGKKRLYRFDLFGSLLEKFKSDSTPLFIIWDEEQCEYLIGFDDYRIRRFTARLKPTGEFFVPDRMEPRLLACGGKKVYLNDLGQRIICVNFQGEILYRCTLEDEVRHMLFVKALKCLVVSTATGVIALTSDLQQMGSIPHVGPEAIVASSSCGEIWVAVACGQLWLLSKDFRKLHDVEIPAKVRSIAVLEKALVLGTIKGQILLYDKLGRKIGEDNLGVPVYHICVMRGEWIVLSTAKGPTVVKPRGDLLLQSWDQAYQEAARNCLLAWEMETKSDFRLRQLMKERLDRLDLGCWQEVCAFQHQFAERRRLEPALYNKIESFLRFIDPQKADRICSRTVPVVIDGSNVSRYHWGNRGKGSKQARLEFILRVRDKLAKHINPVYYPLVIVVDATERFRTDDPATLKRLIEEGEILEAPSKREADALILNIIKMNNWQDMCRIVSNDRRLFHDHCSMVSGLSDDWYDHVRMAFAINLKTLEVYFP